MFTLPVVSNREIGDSVSSFWAPAGDSRLRHFQSIAQCCSSIRLGLQPDLFADKFDCLISEFGSDRVWDVPTKSYKIGQSSLEGNKTGH